MTAAFSLASYLAAVFATVVFWTGISEESLLLRVAAAVIATAGIWLAESGERKAGMSGMANAATLNVALLLVMTAISLYLHFTN